MSVFVYTMKSMRYIDAMLRDNCFFFSLKNIHPTIVLILGDTGFMHPMSGIPYQITEGVLVMPDDRYAYSFDSALVQHGEISELMLKLAGIPFITSLYTEDLYPYVLKHDKFYPQRSIRGEISANERVECV